MKHRSYSIHLSLAILFVGIFSFALYHDIAAKSKSSIPKIVKKVQAEKVDRPLPTLISSPTPTPKVATSSAAITYSGYCLYIPVLMYHHVQPWAVAQAHGQTSLTVDPTIFDQQMAYISTHYTTISAQQLVDALRSHTALPPHSMVVTLDDGYEDVYEYAYPIFQKYHIIANVMVPTGLLGGVGNNSYFTWGQLKQMVDSGLVYATDHTWSHYAVGSGNPQKDQFEIMTAKQQLEQNVDKPITIFTYPYGNGALNTGLVNLLQQDGFTGAFSSIGGSMQCDSFIYSLHRTHIGNAPLPAYGF